MDLDELNQEIENKIIYLSDNNAVDEIFNLIYDLKPDNTEDYKLVCETFDILFDDDNNITNFDKIRNNLAMLSIVYMSYIDKPMEFPIYFNEKLENMRVFYIDSGVFIFNGFELEVNLDEQTDRDFFDSLRNTRYKKIIDINVIFKLLELYNDYGDFDVAIGDYLMEMRKSEELLSDFSMSVYPNLNCFSEQEKNVILNMIEQQRLDGYSLSLLIKGKELQ